MRAPRLAAVNSIARLLYRGTRERQARDLRQGRKADARQQSMDAAPLTRADVVRLVGQNGGPSQHDLAGCNLEGVDLSGLDLEGIVLGDATRKLWANLRNANLSDSVLTGAKLAYSDMSGAYLRRAKLQRTDLRWVEAAGADLREAKLQWGDLYQASLTNANLLGADLRNVGLYLTDLRNSQIERASLGRRELHEPASAYTEFNEIHRHHSPEASAERLAIRHRLARDIFLNLMSNWQITDRLADAGWAYRKKRQMERAMKAPWRAYYHGAQGSKAAHVQKTGMLRRSLKSIWYVLTTTVSWLLDWFTESTCGYGESVSRAVLSIFITIVVAFPVLYFIGGDVGYVIPGSSRPITE